MLPQIQDRPFWKFIYMPQIRDTFLHLGQYRVPVLRQSLHTVQSDALDFGQTSAPRALLCPRFRADHCTPCINMPQISGKPLPPMHKRTPDSGQTSAHRALSCPRFRTDLCTPGNGMSQIWGWLFQDRNDNNDFPDWWIHFRNTMSQNPPIPTENINELSRNPDISCRFKNAMFQISDMSRWSGFSIFSIWETWIKLQC